MNSKITFKSLLVVISLLLSFNLQAQDAPPVTVNVVTAGTLPSLIASSKKYQITNLTVTGNLNGTDILYIREMAGSESRGFSTDGKLSVLDLSGAKIVEGGECYYMDFKTSLNRIGYYAFYHCSKLASINLGNSVTSIGDYAFYNTGLTSITIPNSVISIGEGAFKGCPLTAVTIPDGVASIGYYAFDQCSTLKEYIVTENNTKYCSVEGVLFNKNSTELIAYPNAKSKIYVIPNTVTSIRYQAFYNCSNLTSVTIPNSITSIVDKVFYGCSGLTSVTIPNSVTSIGSEVFTYCYGLTSITIPNSVTSIGNSSFANCRELISVTIGNGVKSIGSSFYNCNNIKEIHCKSLVPPNISSNAFYGINKTTCKLYIPKGSYVTYWGAASWGDFTNIIEEESTAIQQIKGDNIKVFTEQNTIVVTGTKLEDNISVYTESGALLQTTKVTDSIIKITVPVNHTYLVRASGKTFKVAL